MSEETITVLNRVLDPTPHNRELSALVSQFLGLGHVVIDVEPGDLTRYIFILVEPRKVPTWEPGAWFIVPLSGLSVEKASNHEMGFMPEFASPHDFHWLSNTHSQHFISVWIRWFHAKVEEAKA